MNSEQLVRKGKSYLIVCDWDASFVQRHVITLSLEALSKQTKISRRTVAKQSTSIGNPTMSTTAGSTKPACCR